ncbi:MULTISPECIES: restriction endonuclease subunit S [unclassified Corynebacterium]|uniref:restriction endonuclease subunit S n=1 Tax=unclassified Corynebacterium TaxID=2624378 RepID=UPI000B0674C4|nr:MULTISPECIES: restriction endonuclease subunit S [unclassified Corynebacterium]MDU1461153.1 restriction endonuclease subunit S [Corynebacterium sp.]MDU2590686.1 restriction endonuclease subunit S [Atopobium sp.]MDU5018204.1 restriction endonuclease subunit S [Corynebacterium sp.]
MPKLRIREIGEVFDGPHATPKRRKEGKYFLNISSLQNGRLILDESDFIDDEDFQRWTRRVTPRENDLLFSYETRLGEAALMPPDIDAALGRRMALLRPNPEVVDPTFLLYYWLSPKWQQKIAQNTLYGATVNRLPITTLPNWEITLPELKVQRPIGRTLASLDDKIAANNRAKGIALDLIKTLGGKPTNTVKLSVLCERSTRSIKPETIEAKTVLHYSLPAFDLGAPAQEDPATIKSNKFSLERPCVLLSKLNPHTPRIWSVPVINEDVPMIASSEFVVLRPTTCTQAQLFAATAQPELFHHLESLTGGTSKSHQRVRPADILTSEVPDTRTLSAEELQMLELLTLRFESLVVENQVLARTRDELLPLLMSGRITVGEAEDAADEAASES